MIIAVLVLFTLMFFFKFFAHLIEHFTKGLDRFFPTIGLMLRDITFVILGISAIIKFYNIHVITN